MNLQPLYGRPLTLQGSSRAAHPMAEGALTPEVVARVDEALRAQCAEDLPSASAAPLYAILTAHGLDRRDILALAASLVDLVTGDVTSPASEVC